MNHLEYINGNRIESRGLQVRPFSSTKKIVTRMLDGTNNVQQIGDAATRLEISVATSNKAELDELCADCEVFKVYHFGTVYTGFISSEEITWEPVISNLMYRGSFSFVVSEVND